MSYKCKVEIPNFNKNQLIKEMAKLEQLMGKQWLDTTYTHKVAEKCLKMLNNPISIEVNTDYRMKLVGEHQEIRQKGNISNLDVEFPMIWLINCYICGEIYCMSNLPESELEKDAK